MNERIRELAEQAGFDVETLVRPYPGGFPREDMLALESFAQLIVEECLTQVDKMRDAFEADDEDEQALGADWVGLAIAKHFGVES